MNLKVTSRLHRNQKKEHATKSADGFLNRHTDFRIIWQRSKLVLNLF